MRPEIRDVHRRRRRSAEASSRATATRCSRKARAAAEDHRARSRKPAEKVAPWWEYRERFLTEERIAEGAQFWHRAPRAARAASPASTASRPSTWSPSSASRRSTAASPAATACSMRSPRSPSTIRRAANSSASELEQFLLLTREETVDPLTALGSYAGAMGAPQFMPSSYRRYAVDGNGDGQRDLWHDWDDVIASVANYFQRAWLGGRRPGAGRGACCEPDAPTFTDRPAQSRAERDRREPAARKGVDVRRPTQPATTPGAADARRAAATARRIASASRTSK